MRKVIGVVGFVVAAFLLAPSAHAELPPGCYVTGPCDSSSVCGDDGRACTADFCGETGQCVHCPTVGNVCRPANGSCDPAEVCTAGDLACPADQLAPAGEVCRSADGVCDVAEVCTGFAAWCPADTFRGGVVCRGSADDCDPAEMCDGTQAECPADVAADPLSCDLPPAVSPCLTGSVNHDGDCMVETLAPPVIVNGAVMTPAADNQRGLAPPLLGDEVAQDAAMGCDTGAGTGRSGGALGLLFTLGAAAFIIILRRKSV